MERQISKLNRLIDEYSILRLISNQIRDKKFYGKLLVIFVAKKLQITNDALQLNLVNNDSLRLNNSKT